MRTVFLWLLSALCLTHRSAYIQVRIFKCNWWLIAFWKISAYHQTSSSSTRLKSGENVKFAISCLHLSWWWPRCLWWRVCVNHRGRGPVVEGILTNPHLSVNSSLWATLIMVVASGGSGCQWNCLRIQGGKISQWECLKKKQCLGSEKQWDLEGVQRERKR